MILGAGGTALALAYALKQKGVKVYIANRSKERFKDFLAYPTYLYKNLQDFDFWFGYNSTSAGLKDENLPCDRELLDRNLPKAKICFWGNLWQRNTFL